MKSVLISLILFVAALASARETMTCSTAYNGEPMSDAAREWLRGERSSTDPELVLQKKIRQHSEEMGLEVRFEREVFGKIREILEGTDSDSAFLPASSYIRPVRLAALLFRLSEYSTVLNSQQKSQLDNYSRDRSPFRVEDWGYYEYASDLLYGIAATLVEPQNYAQAKTTAFLKKTFELPNASRTFLRTGGMEKWIPSEADMVRILFEHNPEAPTFHPILLTNARVKAAIESNLTYGKNSEPLASNIAHYIFRNIDSSAQNLELMRLFNTILVQHPGLIFRVMGRHSAVYISALEIASSLGLQSSR